MEPGEDTRIFPVLGFQFGEQLSQIRPGECPVERRRRPFVPRLEGQQPVLELAQRRKVVRRDDLALDDRE